MESLKPTTQLVAHTMEGVRFYSLTEAELLLKGGDVLESTGPLTKQVTYSDSGKHLLIVNSENIVIFDTFSAKIKYLLKTPPPGYEFDCAAMSPCEKYILVFTKPVAKKGTAVTSVLLFDFALSSKIHEFEVEKLAREALLDFKFRPKDDYLVWRSDKRKVHVFKLDEPLLSQEAVIETEHRIDTFDISQGPSADKFLILLASAKISPSQGITMIYEFPKFVKRTKFKVDHPSSNEVIFHLAPDDHAVIIEMNQYVDESGQSYYGAQRALFVQIYHGKRKGYLPVIDGQLGDISWNPSSADFILISGNQPATSIVYNWVGQAKFQLGRSKKNTVLYSPVGNMVCIAGFGNLAGEMDYFQRGASGDQKMEKGQVEIAKIGDAKSECSVGCWWDSSGRYLLTGVLTPRIRVENEFRIFKYNGALLHREKLYETELYTVAWRPSPKGVFHAFEASPKASAKTPVEDKKPAVVTKFASSKFAALMEKEMGGPRGEPHWLEGHEFDSHLPKVDAEKAPKPAKEAAPVANWRTFGKLSVPEPAEGVGGDSEKKKKKKKKE